jgi:hypothetical protein
MTDGLPVLLVISHILVGSTSRCYISHVSKEVCDDEHVSHVSFVKFVRIACASCLKPKPPSITSPTFT